ncbi:MAG: type II toxin-antitoxin system VapC family toxin [Eubacterium sp.]|nr:type II toxin-antitoxin system VapC family toxin [Eubacterium sp.]
MSVRYYLDTNIIIYAVKGIIPKFSDRFVDKEPGDIMIPAIALSEIEYGAQKSFDYRRTMGVYIPFLRAFRIAPFTAKAAFYTGKIRADLEKKGTPIGMNDTMIAGTVLAENGVLVTHNVREFERVEGLRVVDWTK